MTLLTSFNPTAVALNPDPGHITGLDSNHGQTMTPTLSIL